MPGWGLCCSLFSSLKPSILSVGLRTSSNWLSDYRNKDRCTHMKMLFNIGAALLLLFFVQNGADAQQKDVSAADPDFTAGSLSVIPDLPHGKSTILGGAIRDVDPVLDRFTLNIMGEKPMRILFDERTQLFLDGKKIPLRDLHAAQHASVQTTLDGTSVFAISVHILSQLQQGDYRGAVQFY